LTPASSEAIGRDKRQQHLPVPGQFGDSLCHTIGFVDLWPDHGALDATLIDKDALDVLVVNLPSACHMTDTYGELREDGIVHMAKIAGRIIESLAIILDDTWDRFVFSRSVT
jgi:hypothetical protein